MAHIHRFHLPFDQEQLALPTQDLLIMRPSGPDGLDIIPKTGIMVEQGFRPIFDQLQNAGYTAEPHVNFPFQMVVVNLTRHKIENLANIARAARLSTGTVLVNGAKTDGIESVLKQVRKIAEVDGVISKSHGKVFWFKAASLSVGWENEGHLSQNQAGFLTAAGMFSAEKIDSGSRILEPYLRNLSGEVADFGAGWGWLAHAALANNPEISTIDLLEAEHAALTAAQQNVTDPRARFEWADIRNITGKTYNVVISNPPFHEVRAADPKIGKDFIMRAAKSLKPKGRLLMVANRHLPYEQTLSDSFKAVQVLDVRDGFKVIEARNPLK